MRTVARESTGAKTRPTSGVARKRARLRARFERLAEALQLAEFLIGHVSLSRDELAWRRRRAEERRQSGQGEAVLFTTDATGARIAVRRRLTDDELDKLPLQAAGPFDLSLAVAWLIEKLSEILPSGRGQLAVQAVAVKLEREWKKLSDDADIERALIFAWGEWGLPGASDAPLADGDQMMRDEGGRTPFVDRFTWELDEELARAILRAALQAFGVSAKKAAELVRKLPSRIEDDDRLGRVADIACELVEFGAAKTVKMRRPSRQIHAAYLDWHERARIPGTPLSAKAFFAELKRAAGVDPRTFGSDGKRARGWSGIGLRPATEEPAGTVAKRSRATFAKAFADPSFGEKLDEARAKWRETLSPKPAEVTR
jgi:hypothetical protein